MIFIIASDKSIESFFVEYVGSSKWKNKYLPVEVVNNLRTGMGVWVSPLPIHVRSFYLICQWVTELFQPNTKAYSHADLFFLTFKDAKTEDTFSSLSLCCTKVSWCGCIKWILIYTQIVYFKQKIFPGGNKNNLKDWEIC